MAVTYETLKSFCADEYALRPQLHYAIKRGEYWWASDGYRIICVPMNQTQQGDMRFLCDEMPNDAGAYPNVESIIDVKGFKSKFTIKVSAIKDAMSNLPKIDAYAEVKRELNFIECPECDDGEIEIEDSVYYKGNRYELIATCQCPICHGYGKIPDVEGYDPDCDDYDPDEASTYIEMVKTGRKIPDLENTMLHIKGTAYIKSSNFNSLLRVANEQGVSEIECAGGNYNSCVVFRMNGVIVGLMPMIKGKSDKRTVRRIKIEE